MVSPIVYHILLILVQGYDALCSLGARNIQELAISTCHSLLPELDVLMDSCIDTSYGVSCNGELPYLAGIVPDPLVLTRH